MKIRFPSKKGKGFWSVEVDDKYDREYLRDLENAVKANMPLFEAMAEKYGEHPSYYAGLTVQRMVRKIYKNKPIDT